MRGVYEGVPRTYKKEKEMLSVLAVGDAFHLTGLIVAQVCEGFVNSFLPFCDAEPFVSARRPPESG